MSVSQAVAIAANSALVRAALVEDDLREDGRTTRESRSVVVKCFHAKGNASDLGPETSQVTTCDVRLGQTRACATMSATIGEPPVDRAHEGQFTVFVDASTCDLDVVSSEKVVEISRCLDLLLKHSRAIDLESLCIIPARQAWSLRLDVRVLEVDGNLLDACAIAAVGAAKAFRRPEYKLRDESGRQERAKVVPLSEREGLRTTVHHTPFTVSFVAFRTNPKNQQEKGGEENLEPEQDLDEDDDEGYEEANFVYAIDPTLAEETICDARVTVAADSEGYVRLVRKAGGCALPMGDITLLSRLACVKAREMGEHLDKVCQAFDLQTKQERIRRKKGQRQMPAASKKDEGTASRHFSSQGMSMPDFDRQVPIMNIDEAKLGLLDDDDDDDDARQLQGGDDDVTMDTREEHQGGMVSSSFLAKTGGPSSLELKSSGKKPASSSSNSDRAAAMMKEGKGKNKGASGSPTHLRDAFTAEFLSKQ